MHFIGVPHGREAVTQASSSHGESVEDPRPQELHECFSGLCLSPDSSCSIGQSQWQWDGKARPTPRGKAEKAPQLSQTSLAHTLKNPNVATWTSLILVIQFF